MEIPKTRYIASKSKGKGKGESWRVVGEGNRTAFKEDLKELEEIDDLKELEEFEECQELKELKKLTELEELQELNNINEGDCNDNDEEEYCRQIELNPQYCNIVLEPSKYLDNIEQYKMDKPKETDETEKIATTFITNKTDITDTTDRTKNNETKETKETKEPKETKETKETRETKETKDQKPDEQKLELKKIERKSHILIVGLQNNFKQALLTKLLNLTDSENIYTITQRSNDCQTENLSYLKKDLKNNLKEHKIIVINNILINYNSNDPFQKYLVRLINHCTFYNWTLIYLTHKLPHPFMRHTFDHVFYAPYGQSLYTKRKFYNVYYKRFEDHNLFKKLFVSPDKDLFVYCGLRYQIFDQDVTVQY